MKGHVFQETRPTFPLFPSAKWLGVVTNQDVGGVPLGDFYVDMRDNISVYSFLPITSLIVTDVSYNDHSLTFPYRNCSDTITMSGRRRPAGKGPLKSPQKSAIAQARSRSGGQFARTTGGKRITAASVGAAPPDRPGFGGKTTGPIASPAPASSSYGGKTNGPLGSYNVTKPSSSARGRGHPLKSAEPITPTRPPPEKRQYTGGKFVAGYTPSGPSKYGARPADTDTEGAEQTDNFSDQSDPENDDDDVGGSYQAVHVPEDSQSDWEEEIDIYNDGSMPPPAHSARPASKGLKNEDDSEFQPEDDEEAVQDDMDMDYAVVEGSQHATRRAAISARIVDGARRSSGVSRGDSRVRRQYATERVQYKKKIRKDASRFTTSTAMNDADDEFHPKLAAFRGRRVATGGNGRKSGRQLIRWSPAADQLLLLCFHHELAMMRDDLPYQQVADRMFPEKNATGGAIKERFAKLRIEMLNRGSWVPPIIGKAPQGIRPNVRGVVRVAPGVDKGRYILWKEDASRLIDPKDIMKGHNDAQGRGEDAPGRIWVSKEAQKEFFEQKAKMEAEGLVPLADPNDYEDDDVEVIQQGLQQQAVQQAHRTREVDVRYTDEVEEEEHQQQEPEIDEELITAVSATPNRKRKALPTGPVPQIKRRNTATRGSTASRAPGKPQQSVEDDSDVVGNSGDKSASKTTDGGYARQTRNKGKTPVEKGIYGNDELLAEATREAAPSPESPEAANGGMMSFEPGEKALPSRRVMILSKVPSRVLAHFPVGQSGPGSEEYFLDEVFDKHWIGERNPGNLRLDANKPVQSVRPAQLKNEDKPAEEKPVNLDAESFLFNSKIVPPSKDNFWKPVMEVEALMAAVDKVVDEKTRPTDILGAVFGDGQLFDVNQAIKKYKANTNVEEGLPRDVNVWYKCACIIRNATTGEYFDKAKSMATKEAPEKIPEEVSEEVSEEVPAAAEPNYGDYNFDLPHENVSNYSLLILSDRRESNQSKQAMGMMNGQQNAFGMNPLNFRMNPLNFGGSLVDLGQGYNPNFLQDHGVMQEHGLAFPNGSSAAMISSQTENMGFDAGQHMFQLGGFGNGEVNDNGVTFDVMVAPGENILQFGDMGMDGGMDDNAAIAGSNGMAGDDGVSSVPNNYGMAEEDMVQFISASVLDNEAFADDGTPDVKDEKENPDVQMS